uniref:Vacuolar fusion protein MON1 homolog n=1 Tax=Aegilops tauschii subsp. strangulata TaxID=200361 RepID=A0A453PXD9_AEGTS
MYGQMLLILTKSVNRCFEKNPKFDMAPLLGGTDAVFRSLIRAFSWNPATFLHAYTCLPLAQATRQAASAALQDIADSGVLFGLLMCDHKDFGVFFTHMLAKIQSYGLPENTYLTLLTPRSDAFFDLKDSRARIQDVILKSNVLLEVQRSLHENVLRVEDVPIDLSSQSTSAPAQSSQGLNSQPLSSDEVIGGPAGLWHFIYRSVYLDQYVSSEFPLPIRNPKQQKRLYKAYQKVYASMHDKATGPHRTQFRKDEDYGELPRHTPHLTSCVWNFLTDLIVSVS